MRISPLVYLAVPAASQQIWDIVRLLLPFSVVDRFPFWRKDPQWQTTWDRGKLFTSLAPSSPINFVTPGPIGSADIVINDGTTFQSIAGFGGSLSMTLPLHLHFWLLMALLGSGFFGIGSQQLEGSAEATNHLVCSLSHCLFMLGQKLGKLLESVDRDVRSNRWC